MNAYHHTEGIKYPPGVCPTARELEEDSCVEYTFKRSLTETEQEIVGNQILLQPGMPEDAVDWVNSRTLRIWPNGFGLTGGEEHDGLLAADDWDEGS